MAEVYKTCLFKIHNPSKRRRAMLLDCLRRNERAYWKILDNVKADAEEDAVMAKKVAAATDAFKIELDKESRQSVALKAHKKCIGKSRCYILNSFVKIKHRQFEIR